MSPGELAPYAADETTSRGRRHPEPPSAWRGEYSRDRDRIIHSTAFRRLMYKTQVFVNHEGDLYRTRLTHSLEVAQIGRTVAVALCLSEPLTEAICLAHDLGHTPFGHAGQDALNECMRAWGGFEHNLQSLRVVDELEARYAEFPGLNLMFETREGILKHCSARNARELGELGVRFLERTRPGLEAQIADIADAIAYNHHDVDDGLRAGLIGLEQLCTQSLFGEHYDTVRERFPDLPAGDRRFVFEVIRRMIGAVVTDLIRTSTRLLDEAAPASIDEVRRAGRPLIALSAPMQERHVALKKFLNEHLYRHEKKLEMTARVQTVVRDLFNAYMSDNLLMSEDFSTRASGLPEAGRARVVADYIAGMTDRYAFGAHARLGPGAGPRR